MFGSDTSYTVPLPFNEKMYTADEPLRVAVLERHAALVSPTCVRADVDEFFFFWSLTFKALVAPSA